MIKNILNPDWASLPPLQVNNCKALNNQLRVDSTAGLITVSLYRPGVFRIQAGQAKQADYGLLKPGSDTTCEAKINAQNAVLSSGELRLSLATEGALTLRVEKNQQLLFESSRDGHFVRKHRLPPLCAQAQQWLGAFELAAGEPVYGLGEKWATLNKRGQLIHSFNHDALGANAEISYKNSPFLWSPRGWGLLFNTPASVHHAIGFGQWSNRNYAFLLDDTELDLLLLTGADGTAILRQYAELTGFAPEVPDWSLGVWMSRAYYRTADEVLATARDIRARKLPCEVITLDGRAWLDTATRFAFEWDKSRYPNPKQITAELHQLGFKVCVWEYPLVSVQSPLFAEMAKKGWLLKDQTGAAYCYEWDRSPFGEVLTPLPTSGIVDFTHPDAYAYWRERHNELFDAGVDVIKSDFGEQVPPDAVAHNGDSGRRLHNVYSLLYNRCVFEATERYFGQGFVFARSGWLGSQNYPAQWGGDPQADWGGLGSSLAGALNWALSGNPCYASDIGGYYGDQRDPDLYIRWTQLAVFASHMRFHGIGQREPWYYGEQAETIVRQFIDLRYRLIPYIKRLLRTAQQTGLPPMRAMVLAYPDDPLAWPWEQQFLFGPDIFVAPVLNPAGQVRYYLPPGEWRNYWTQDVLSGGQVIEEIMPLEQLPLYLRVGFTVQPS